MNISFLLGFGIILFTLVYGFLGGPQKLGLFFHKELTLALVFGTLAIALMIHPMARLGRFFKFFLFGILFKSRTRNPKFAQEVIQLYYSVMLQPENFEINFKFHPYLCEGAAILKKGSLSEEDFRGLLQARMNHFQEEALADTRMFSNLAKYPPLLVLLFSLAELLKTSDPKGSLQVFLIGSFWAWVLSGLIFWPWIDYSRKILADEVKTRSMIRDGLLIIQKRLSVAFLVDAITAYLPFEDRKKIKDFAHKTLGQNNLARARKETA